MPGDFTDLVAWQQALALAADIALIDRRIRGSAAQAFRDQLRRAVESIPANIAEGYGRGFGADYGRFLRIASASAAEVESHLRVAVATGRIEEKAVTALIERCRRVRALIRGLYRKAVAAPRERLTDPLTHS